MDEKHLTPAAKIAQRRELYQLVDKKNPSEGDILAFRKELEKIPDLWRAFGDMCRQAELHLIDATGVPKSSKEAMSVGMDVVRRDLGQTTATPMERMIIEQIALCWLRLSIVEVMHADHHTASGTIGIPQADYWDRALSSAQRRYLRAIETLARVRRLLRPNAVQVNIGAKQLNVANMGMNDAEQ
jgi:hypothetical protein